MAGPNRGPGSGRGPGGKGGFQKPKNMGKTIARLAEYVAKNKLALVLVLLCLAALSMLAVGAHLAMLEIKPGRYSKVLEPLLGDMWNYEFVTAAAWEDDGWSGVYLLIMALLSRVETFSWLYAVKLIDLICQCLAAGAVLRLAMIRGAKAYGALAAMFAAVLSPTMLMNALCIAIYAMFVAIVVPQTKEEKPHLNTKYDLPSMLQKVLMMLIRRNILDLPQIPQ